jgi:hypothetical protein
MAKRRKRYLPAFLEAEGLARDVRDGVRLICEIGDRDPEEVLDFLGTVEVKPTRALGKYGSAQIHQLGLIPPEMRITVLPLSAWKRQDTIRHEVAHLVAWHVFGPQIRTHGREWQAAAKALGATPQARHYDPAFMAAANEIQESRLKIVARCVECGFEILATRRTSKYARNLYRHRHCGGRIAPVD